MSIAWRAAGATDVGRVRESNEDRFFLDSGRGIFLVADGMGGHAAGEVASTLATEAVSEGLVRALDEGHRGDALLGRLKAAFEEARHQLAHCCEDRPQTRGMGTTMTAVVLAEDGSYRLGHLGDSRAYRLRAGRLEQLTRDHTWVQREVDAGRLNPAAARTHRLSHIVTRVLGAGGHDEPDLLTGTLHPGDLLLLVTDGLSGPVDDAEITRLLTTPRSLEGRVDALIAAANERGGSDNITAVLVEVLPGR